MSSDPHETIWQPWHHSTRADPRALPLADRHYRRRRPGSRQFVPPGRCLVLLTRQADALWVTSWPLADYVKHAWAGAMVCTLFRREPECPHLASDLIVAATAAARARWPDLHPHGIVTFVDPAKVRHKRDPGRCYRRAGWTPVGTTAGGLIALQLMPADWPEPACAWPRVPPPELVPRGGQRAGVAGAGDPHRDRRHNGHPH